MDRNSRKWEFSSIYRVFGWKKFDPPPQRVKLVEVIFFLLVEIMFRSCMFGTGFSDLSRALNLEPVLSVLCFLWLIKSDKVGAVTFKIRNEK